MSWKPEVDELRRREQLAARMGGEERVARQRDAAADPHTLPRELDEKPCCRPSSVRKPAA